MVYIFDPTTCEEPKKPTYKYSPIPKAVECSCCPNPADYEEGNNTEVTLDEVSTNNEESIGAGFIYPEEETSPDVIELLIYGINGKVITSGYVLNKLGIRHELTIKDTRGFIRTTIDGQYDFEPFDLFKYADTGEEFVARLSPKSYIQI